MTNTKQATLTAAREAEAQDLLNRIAKQLESNQANHAGNPSWGYAADLASVNEKLAYILAQLGDRSAVDAKGLSY